MQTQIPSSHRGYGISTLSYVVALVAGVSLGLLFAPKDGSALRKGLAKKVKNMAAGFTKNREQLQAEVEEIWGEVTDELEKDYKGLRNQLLSELDEVKNKASFTRRKYDELVEDIVDSYSDEKQWAHSSVNRLQKHIKNEWEDFKDHFHLNEEKATQAD